MRAFFEGIADLFVNHLFAPYDFFRLIGNWWASNSVNWVFAVIGFLALLYWLKQLQVFEQKGEEDHSVTAHSYL